MIYLKFSKIFFMAVEKVFRKSIVISFHPQIHSEMIAFIIIYLIPNVQRKRLLKKLLKILCEENNSFCIIKINGEKTKKITIDKK